MHRPDAKQLSLSFSLKDLPKEARGPPHVVERRIPSCMEIGRAVTGVCFLQPSSGIILALKDECIACRL